MTIKLENVNYVYNPGTPFESSALKGVNLEMGTHEFIGLIGHTGSGKSTLVQHLNGLMKPTSGRVLIDDVDTVDKNLAKKGLRQRVGLVFQYPEHQLFEETIAKDIAFGPKNQGLSDREVEERVRTAMEMVGLGYEALKDHSPFELSGGQKRRVAIAGVLAMNPTYLVLDEPTAGLDPKGRDEILDEIKKLYDNMEMTIVLVSHSMEDVARLVNRLIVMDDGRVLMDGTPVEVFRREEELREIGLDIPQITATMRALAKKGMKVNTDVLTVKEAAEELKRVLGGGDV